MIIDASVLRSVESGMRLPSWEMGWISGYSCSQLMRFLKSLPRPGPGYQISVFTCLCWLLSRLSALTLTGNISNICHQLPILPHAPHSSLQLQSSISTKEMKTRLGFYMHRAIQNLPASLSCCSSIYWLNKIQSKSIQSPYELRVAHHK